MIQARAKRRNTMDSIYFNELLEKSENITEEENGKYCKLSLYTFSYTVRQNTMKMILAYMLLNLIECISAPLSLSYDILFLMCDLKKINRSVPSYVFRTI